MQIIPRGFSPSEDPSRKIALSVLSPSYIETLSPPLQDRKSSSVKVPKSPSTTSLSLFLFSTLTFQDIPIAPSTFCHLPFSTVASPQLPQTISTGTLSWPFAPYNCPGHSSPRQASIQRRPLTKSPKNPYLYTGSQRPHRTVPFCQWSD